MRIEDIRVNADYHTHTNYSHGKGSVEDNIKKAIELGLKEICISDHGIKHFLVGMTKKTFTKQCFEIEELRKKYQQIKILKGVEANLRGMSGKIDVDDDMLNLLDVLLCGFHMPVIPDRAKDNFSLFFTSYHNKLFKPTPKQIARNTQAYLNMVENNPIDIITHINYHLKVEVKPIAELCKEKGTYLEISSRHSDCAENDFRDMIDSGVKFVINSDAHKTDNIANCDGAKKSIIEYGIPLERIMNINENSPNFRSRKR